MTGILCLASRTAKQTMLCYDVMMTKLMRMMSVMIMMFCYAQQSVSLPHVHRFSFSPRLFTAVLIVHLLRRPPALQCYASPTNCRTGTPKKMNAETLEFTINALGATRGKLDFFLSKIPTDALRDARAEIKAEGGET